MWGMGREAGGGRFVSEGGSVFAEPARGGGQIKGLVKKRSFLSNIWKSVDSWWCGGGLIVVWYCRMGQPS